MYELFWLELIIFVIEYHVNNNYMLLWGFYCSIIVVFYTT